MSIADELQKLQQLHQSGAINDVEFADAKARILSAAQPAQPGYAGSMKADTITARRVKSPCR